jgi:hypothetical protein
MWYRREKYVKPLRNYRDWIAYFGAYATDEKPVSRERIMLERRWS